MAWAPASVFAFIFESIVVERTRRFNITIAAFSRVIFEAVAALMASLYVERLAHGHVHLRARANLFDLGPCGPRELSLVPLGPRSFWQVSGH